MNTPSTPSSLPRALGPIVATAVVAGTVIGSGIFKKPQLIAEHVPYFGLVALVWIAGGVLAFLGALAYAEVATLYPRAGGNYVFLREGYGRMFGFLWGWVDFFMIRSSSIAALATIFTQSLHAVLAETVPDVAAHLTDWPQRLITVSVIVLLALVNARGVKWGGGVQLLVTIVKVGSLIFLVALPFIALWLVSDIDGRPPRSPDPERLGQIWPGEGGWKWALLPGFLTALLGAQWAYHGWQNIAPIAGEVKNPQRNLPLSLLLGVGIVIVLYLSVNLAYSLVLSRDEMKVMKKYKAEEKPAGTVEGEEPEQKDTTVAIGFCRQLLGPVGVAIAAAAVMISVFGALNGNLLVGPRLLYAMGEDGLAPRVLSEIHPRYQTPAAAIMVLSAWACLLVLGVAVLTDLGLLDPEKDNFDTLTDLAMFGAIIFETMAVLAIFVFRYKLPNVERPYRCIGYPVVPVLYVILPALILWNYFRKEQESLSNGQAGEASIGSLIVAAGAVVYFLLEFGRPARRPPHAA